MKKSLLIILLSSISIASWAQEDIRSMDYWSNNIMQAHNYVKDNCSEDSITKQDAKSALSQNCTNASAALKDYKDKYSCCG